MNTSNTVIGEAPQSSSAACAQTTMNLSLFDPPRWGWSAVGGMAELLTPQERSRRRTTQVAYRKQRRRAMSDKGTGQQDTRIEANSLPIPSVQASIAVAAASSSAMSCSSESRQEKPQTQQPPPAMPAATIGNAPLAPTSALPLSQVLGNSNDAIPLNGGIHGSKIDGDANQTDESFWGMSLNQRSSENESYNNASSEQVIEAAVDSVKDGILDMYAYHRGREGMEPRDVESGELLCSQIATDTNHAVEAPKLAVTITVEFPLEDETYTKDKKSSEEPHDAISTGESDSCRKPAMYREFVPWDLSNPSTPSPLSFSTNIADEYGLSFGQMIDLATSIQEQIDAHLLQHSTYRAAIALRDPLGNDRRFAGPTRRTHRYDQVVRQKEGGTPFVKTRGQRLSERLSRPKSNSSNAGSTGSARGRRREERQYDTINMHQDDEEIEEKYSEEVKARSKQASQRLISERCLNGTIGLLEKKSDFHCHICHKRTNITYSFACQVVSHAYCAMHCKNRLDLDIEQGSPATLDFCPVCSLNCQCSSCCRKLSSVARDFKRQCEGQNSDLSETVFDDVLERCQTASSTRSVARVAKVVKRKVDEPVPATRATVRPTTKTRESGGKARHSRDGTLDVRQNPTVPKPPLVDFPREVCGSVELHPGTPDDYMKVYTAEGSFSVDTYPEAWALQEVKNSTSEVGDETPLQREMKIAAEGKEEIDSRRLDFFPSKEAEVAEDGNVDYCQVCQTAGNLLCCDFCPRAYHPHCLKNSAASEAVEDVWRCVACEQEANGLEDDLIDGKGSRDKILSAFSGMDVSSDETVKAVETLSVIHEMLLKLIAYDFGFMFRQPVAGVAGYEAIVKHPMDLGTICSKLTHGDYCDTLKQGKSYDDVIVAVMNDVELVWHNCFLFNSVDSAVYRMAGVHRRRAASIRRKSFDHLLSISAKAAVQDYASSCERTRGLSQNAVPSAEEKVLRAKRPKGKHKIGVKASNNGLRKVVAILDPSSSRIVKMFSSIKSALQAVDLLQNLGHQCEWTAPDGKAIILRSSADPSLLLFGYRWLQLEDLQSKKVKFPKPSTTFIEAKHDSYLYVFLSIEEALCFSALPLDADIDEIRNKLRCVPDGSEWVEHFGIAWRRPVVKEKGGKYNKENTDARPYPVDDEIRLLAQCVAIKEDLVTGRKLVGFGSISTAYDDWLQTVACSPTFADSEATSMGDFKQYYLDGDHNIDGIVWRSIVDQDAKSEVSKIAQSNSNLHFAKAETSKSNDASFHQVHEPNDKAATSETNSIEVLRNSQQDAIAIQAQAGPEKLSKISSAVALGKRKRPMTDDQSNQWGLPCGGESVNGVESPRRQNTVA